MEGGTLLFCGQALSTFDKFKKELHKVEDKTKHVFTICCNISVESGNSMRLTVNSSKAKINPNRK